MAFKDVIMELEKKSIHFVGIGGIGMCGLAELLHNLGGFVTGSDLHKGEQVDRLLKIGIPISIGHSPENITDKIDALVFSSAISMDNPEIKEARRRGLPIIPRAKALAEMMRLKKNVVVAGTHGKTSTTGLLASIFSQADRDPTVVAGGRLDLFKSTARLGKGAWFIAESDESDAGFHHLSPELVVLTNIDKDHLDFYGSFEKLLDSFKKFLKRVPFYGAIIACGDCKNVREVLSDPFSKKVWFYGMQEDNDFVLKKEQDAYHVYFKNKLWLTFKSPMLGDYNALNALGSLVCGWESGIDKETLIKGLSSFKGVDRRMQYKGKVKGVTFYDDYAHHPTEIEQALQGLASSMSKNRKVVLFQPHRYTRFRDNWQGFLTSFQACELLYVSPVYSANESRIEGITSEEFVRQIKHPNCFFVTEEALASTIAKNLKPEDIFITLGAGSVNTFGEACMRRLKSN